MQFSDLSFKKKVYISVIFPIIGLLWVSLVNISESMITSQEMTKLTKLTQVSIVYSELVHELQKERGMTAGYIGSKGKKFAEKLNQQRNLTNEKKVKRERFLSENDFQQPSVLQLNRSINQALDKLQNIRQQVDAQSLSIGDALGYYSELNAQLLSIPSINAQISSNAIITKKTIAYYNFLQGKERAGIERAVLSNTFSSNAFAKGMFEKFIVLVTQQDTYFANFNSLANAKNKQFFTQQMNHPAVDEVLKLRAVAKANQSGFNIDSVHWFEQSTARIGQLKSIENELGQELISLAETQNNNASNSLIYNLVFSIVLISLAIVIAWYIIQDLTKRVNDLKNVMLRVRDENDLTVQAQLLGESELGQTAQALNLTLGKFSGVIDEISNSSTMLAAAAEETAQTCNQNSDSMIAQQDGIALIATAIEELSATVKEVASNTQQTADIAKAADEQAKNGLSVVQESYLSIESLAAEIDGLAKRITNLHESSKNITNVVDVIKSVAEQTNLLALNAAIEAARAGEQGRGFAVVADEVRTLAQRTQDSTQEIESFITTLQSDANSAFSVIETSQKKAASAVESSRNVETGLVEITQSVSHIFAMTEQIATAIEEQAVVTQDVAKNIVEVEQRSMESTTGATQIADTAKEQAQLAASLQDIASIFKV